MTTVPMEPRESVFTGTMLGLLGVRLVTYVLSALTVGLAYPWLMCWAKSWELEHTYIEGRQLRFDGTGLSLFGNWFKWLLLCIVTLGIYLLWLPIKVQQWQVKHTHFADTPIYYMEVNPATREESVHLEETWDSVSGKVKELASKSKAAVESGLKNRKAEPEVKVPEEPKVPEVSAMRFVSKSAETEAPTESAVGSQIRLSKNLKK